MKKIGGGRLAQSLAGIDFLGIKCLKAFLRLFFTPIDYVLKLNYDFNIMNYSFSNKKIKSGIFNKVTMALCQNKFLTNLFHTTCHPERSEGATHVGMSNNNRRAAFTLAEVLITLGIIGIVAAMTIPTLITKYQKKEFATRLSKTYSTLSQAVQRAQVDYGDVSSWGYQATHGTIMSVDEFYNGGQEALCTAYAQKYFMPYLRVVKDYGFGRMLEMLGYESWELKNGNYFVQQPSDYAYVIELSNGVVVFFSFNYGRIEGDDDNLKISDPNIFVDVNGISKPNVMGRDIYLFTLSSSMNKFVPYGVSNSLETLQKGCGYSPTTIYGSYYCAALIQRMGWKITDDYPW